MDSITITTRSGIQFDLLHPLPSMVCIEDVAWHLSGINRWCGAARRHICVLEHALLVVEILEREHGVRAPQVLRAALHHDSDEAYTGDLSGPMKALLRHCGFDFNGATQRIRSAVHAHFGTAIAATQHHALIKNADILSRHTEYRDLVCPPGQQHLHPPGVSWINLNHRAGMQPADWQQAFIDKHEELAAHIDAVAPRAPAIKAADIPY